MEMKDPTPLSHTEWWSFHYDDNRLLNVMKGRHFGTNNDVLCCERGQAKDA